ncbi:hypothetical protein [Chryseolinea soli]|uniref:Uncharacterized protein n=1 Tax=Chryseolinea soli TaxID=2321403 RepID=A0A385SGE0_9BACT|nr:hypothetical protein [Chryseolinea soli]AYB29367.1 hypothetical protein D4L85_01655 [Chryseolinea soli]
MFRLCFLLLTVCVCDAGHAQLTYRVMVTHEAITIDGKWDKPAWKKVESIKIENHRFRHP